MVANVKLVFTCLGWWEAQHIFCAANCTCYVKLHICTKFHYNRSSSLNTNVKLVFTWGLLFRVMGGPKYFLCD